MSGCTQAFNATESEKKGAIKTPLILRTPSGYFEEVVQLPLAVNESETEAAYSEGFVTITLKLISNGENRIKVSF